MPINPTKRCFDCRKQISDPRKKRCVPCYRITRRKNPRETLFKYAKKSGSCLIWTGATDRGGYGIICSRPFGGNIRTHRLSWEIANKREVPKGMYVCHSCDTPACILGSHLFLGTAMENKRDSVAKNRHSFGEIQSASKLTDEKVRKIRNLYTLKNFGYGKIAKMFHVSNRAIARVVKREGWRHVI